MALGASLRCLALLAVALPAYGRLNGCTTLEGSKVHLSGSTYRNLSGHWVSETDVTSNSEMSNRIVLVADGPWSYDIDFKRQQCNGKQSTKTVVTVKASPLGSAKRADYTLVPGLGHYKYHTEPRLWCEAREVCATEGANLAVIQSAEEADAIKDIICKNCGTRLRAWIGFSGLARRGEWYTVFGEPLSSTGYQLWAANQPDSAGADKSCGCVTAEGRLAVCSCAVSRTFVCKRSAA